MKNLSVCFLNSWTGFDWNDNFIYHTLSTEYNVEINQENPDIVICNNTNYSPDNGVTDRYRGKAKIIHWHCESFDTTGLPDYNKCDYSISSCKHEHEKNVRIPLWSFYIQWFESQPQYNPVRNQAYLVSLEQIEKKYPPHKKPKFCCLLTNNGNGFKSEGYPPFLEWSQKQGLVTESRGKAFRNMPPIGDNGFNELSKMQYVKDFKFNLAYDNSDNRGWITEKMIHPMVVGTIPIYWGAVDVAEEFNKHAFLDIRDFENLDALHDRVLQIHNDDSLFFEMQTQPCFPDGKIPECGTPEYIIEELKRIIEA